MHRLAIAALIATSALAPIQASAQQTDRQRDLPGELVLALGDGVREHHADSLADRWRYYEVTISFSAEGEDFELTGTFVCEPYLIGYYSSQVRYSRRGGRLAQRLPSGGALVFGAPDLCGDSYGWERSDEGHLIPTVGLHAGFVPLVYWIDDADDPSLAEIYVSEVYYRGPSPRLTIHEIRVRGVPESPQTDFSDTVANTALRGGPSDLRGLFATVVPRDVWSEVPEVADVLNQIQEPRVFSLEASARISRSGLYLWQDYYTREAENIGIPTEHSQYASNEFVRLASHRVFPILRVDESYQITTSSSGVIILMEGVPIPQALELQIGDARTVFPRSRYWQFVPESGLLVGIQLQTLSIRSAGE